jgi:lysophospholipase
MATRSRIVIVGLIVLIAAYYARKRVRSRNAPKHVVLVHSRKLETEDEIRDVTLRLQKGLAFFTNNSDFGILTGRDGIPIRYSRFVCSTEKATVFFLTGWSESMLKYCDFFQELNENGFTVVAMDHRSQGLSGRSKRALIEHYDAVKSHVEDFHDHLTDALLVFNRTISPQSKVFIVGFSLGGLVATHLATTVKCTGLILLAPCLLPKTPYPVNVVQAITKTLRFLGKGEQFVPGHPFGTDHRMLPPPHSRVSSSSSRIKFWENLRLEQPDVCINGMSVAHLDELISARATSTHVKRLLCDRLLIISAELDFFVDNNAIFEFSENVSHRKPCRHVHVNGSKHELLHEREEIRSRVTDEMNSFMMW